MSARSVCRQTRSVLRNAFIWERQTLETSASELPSFLSLLFDRQLQSSAIFSVSRGTANICARRLTTALSERRVY